MSNNIIPENTSQNTNGLQNAYDPNNDSVVITPIIDINKLNSWNTDFLNKNVPNQNYRNELLNSGLMDKIVNNGNFTLFKNHVDNINFFAGNPITPTEELEDLFNSFRDTKKEEYKKNELKANYILNNKKEYKPEGTIFTDTDTKADLLPRNEVRKDNIPDLELFPLKTSGGAITFKPIYSEKPKDTGIAYSFDDNIIKMHNDSTVWQNQYNVNNTKSNAQYDSDFDYSAYQNTEVLNGLLDSLGPSFLFQDPSDAAEQFNKTLSSYGFEAEPYSNPETSGAFDIYGENERLLRIVNPAGQEQIVRLYKPITETFIQQFGTPLQDEVGGFGSVVRPEFATQKFADFKTLLLTNANNTSITGSIANIISQSEAPALDLKVQFNKISDLGFFNMNDIIDIGDYLDLDIVETDLFDLDITPGMPEVFSVTGNQNALNRISVKINELDEDDFVSQKIELPDGIMLSDKTLNIDKILTSEDIGAFDVLIDKDGNEMVVRDLLRNRVDDMIVKMRNNILNSSKKISRALMINDNYKKFSLLDNPEGNKNFYYLSEIVGMDVYNHMPSEAFKIDGRVVAFTDIYNLVTDPSNVQAIRKGEIKVEIGEPENYGLMEPVVKEAKRLMDRNDADEVYNNEFYRTADNVADYTGNLAKGVFFEISDLVGYAIETGNGLIANTFGLFNEDFGNAYRTTSNINMITTGLGFKQIGFDNLGESFMVSGATGDMNAGVKVLRDEYLPLWTTQISDASTLSEFFYLGNETLATSIPYLGALLYNPYLGYSLIGANAYNEHVDNYFQMKENFKQNMFNGEPLLSTNLELVNSSDFKLRTMGLTKAATEVLITRLFTGQYLKNANIFNKTKIPKTLENSRLLAQQYKLRFDQGTSNVLRRIYGIELKAFANEITEENSIMAFNYLFDSLLGIEEFDAAKMQKMAANTTLASVFSSGGMAVMFRMKGNQNTRKTAELYISSNLSNGMSHQLMYEKLTYEKLLQDMIKKGQSEGISESETKSSESYQAVLDALKPINRQLLEFDNAKDKLVQNMTTEQKIDFLDNLALLEKQEIILNDTSNPMIQRENARKEIGIIRDKLQRIVDEQGTAEAFFFLSDNTKQKYINEAYVLLEGQIDEMLNTEMTEGSQTNISELLIKKAEQLYIQDANNKNLYTGMDLDLTLDLDAGARYGNLDVNQGQVFDMDKNYELEFELSSEINNAKGVLNQAVMFPSRADVIAQTDADARAEQGETDTDTPVTYREQMLNLVSRIERLMTGTLMENENAKNPTSRFYNSLSPFQQKQLKQFFSDITNPKEGRKPQVLRIKSILDAYEMIYDIAGRVDKPIELFPKGNYKPGEIMKSLTQTITSFWQQVNLGFNPLGKSFVSKDIQMNMFFRDKTQGAPLQNLYSELMRNISEIQQKNNKNYIDIVKKYHRGKNPGFSIKRFLGQEDLSIDIYDDYEMQILSGLSRINLDYRDEQGNENKNYEFNRYKNNLLEELDLREQEYKNENNISRKNILKKRYEILKDVVDRLGVVGAQDIDAVLANAQSYNIETVNFIQGLFKNNEQNSFDRLDGFGHKYTRFDNYMPIFVKKDGESFTDQQYNSVDNNPNTINNTGSLQYAPTPDSYRDQGFRMQFGHYLHNSFHALQGTEIDSKLRVNAETLNILINSPEFKQLFSDESQFEMFRKVFGDEFNDQFNKLVTGGRSEYTDFGDASLGGKDGSVTTFITDKLAKVYNLAIGGAAYWKLTALDQPLKQFYSAVGNNYFRVNTSEAKEFLLNKSRLYGTFLAGTTNGKKRTTIIGEYFQDVFGQGDKSELYAMSRTGLRNSILAELPLDNNGMMDKSYYEKFLNKEMPFIPNGSYTIDQIINLISKNTEFSLDIMLARSDRAAANASFEAHYLDYVLQNRRTPEGDLVTYPSDKKGRKEWWANEKKRGYDKNAINYADSIIAELMRSGNDLAEGSFFRSDADGSTRFLSQTFFPFGRFEVNARTNFQYHLQRYLDPNVPQDQKDDSASAMAGLALEVASFDAIGKTFGAITMGTVLTSVLGGDEEAIEEYGGLQPYLFTLIGYKDRDAIAQIEKLKSEGATTKEMLEFIQKRNISNVENLDFVASIQELENYMFTYSKKPDISPRTGNWKKGVITNIAKLVDPSASIPPPVRDGVLAFVNVIAEETGLIKPGSQIFQEFQSEDIKAYREGKITSEALFTSIVENNLGLPGIIVEQYNKLDRARGIWEENVIEKEFRGVPSKQYHGTGIEAIDEQYRKGAAVLYIARLMETFGMLPGPAAELSTTLNQLERSIEKYMTPGAFPDNQPVPGVPTSEREMIFGLDSKADAFFTVYDFLTGEYKNNPNYVPGGTGPLPE
jgi:hypothetical protein